MSLRTQLVVAWLCALAIAFFGCSGKTIPAGGLQVIIASNLSAPGAFDVLRVEVSQASSPGPWKPLLANDYRVPDETALPTTVAIAAGSGPDQDALIRITARKGNQAIVLRVVQIQIPKDRVAELKLIIAASCSGQVRVDVNGDAQSTCADVAQSCQPDTGECGPNRVDPSTLPTYAAGDENQVDAGTVALDASSRVDAADGSVPVGVLERLTISAGTLSPAFDPKVLSYAVTPSASSLGVPFTVTPTAFGGARITVNGAAIISSAASSPIALGLLIPTSVNVTVTPPGGTATHYSLVVPSVQQAYVKASNTRASALFGWQFGCVLALASDGNTLAVGSFSESSNATGINGNQSDTSSDHAGAVYVFARSGGTTWTQQAYVKASNTRYSAYFGISVALSSDGNTLAVGSQGESSNAMGINGNQSDTSLDYAGAVYVFSRTGTAWSQQAYVKASNARAGANFGLSVALSSDGNTLGVGSDQESSNATGVNGNQNNTSANGAGAAYVFSRSGTTWTQQVYVKASNARLSVETSAAFGSSVALSSDGNTLAVGSPGESSDATGIDGNQSDTSATYAGAVYVFSRSGTAWSQQAYAKASHTGGSLFGCSVALSSNGNTLAVGSLGESSNATGINGNQNDTSASQSGAVYVFSRGGTTWSQQAYVKASNTRSSAYFGDSVALSSDGNTLVVGSDEESSAAPGVNGNQSDTSAFGAGAVYVFSRKAAAWSQQAYVKASNPHANAVFGLSVGISSDGNTLAVGSDREGSRATGINGNQSDTSANQAGAVYVLR